ncbi:MAG: hypothetical protein K9N06_12285 [Candidatus Cloacimonetes bacterium]|nr:hypothetical protein [Candidatus Cloacimonadota bacterium]
MKKIIALLLIVAFSAVAFAGDFLNHPTIEYVEWDDGDITLSTFMTGEFLGDPSTWGLEGTFVSSDATNPTANVEPGALTNGDILNLKGMLMKNTNYGGTSYEFYSFVYDDGVDRRLFVGVKAYDDVLHLAYQPYPDVKANRSDYAEFRLDFTNNAAQTGAGNTGAGVMAGTEWAGIYGETEVNDGSVGYGQSVDFFDGCTYEGTEYAAASGFAAWETVADDDMYAGNAFGTHSLGFYVNAWWDLDHALTVVKGTEDPAIGTHAAYGETSYFNAWTKLETFGMGLVVKDHDGEGLDYFDHDRIWSSGLHNTDGTTTQGHAADYKGSGRQSDVQCNTPAVFMSLVKAGRKLDVSSSYATATDFVTLDWDAPTGFDGALTYNVYSSPVYDNSFNVHPDYFDNTVGVMATAPRMYDWAGMWNGTAFYGDNTDGTYTSEWKYANPNHVSYDGNWTKVASAISATDWTSGSMAAYDEYYFLVTVLDGGVEYGFPSDMIGFVKYDCVSNETNTDINFIALPFDMGFDMASDLGDAIGTSNVVTITKWVVAAQGYSSTSYIPGYGWINDFDLEENGCYMLGVVDDFEFVNIGKLLVHPSYDLTYTVTTNMNWVTVPMLTESFCDTAQELVDLVSRPFDGPQKSRVEKVSRWINTTQSWQDCYYAGSWLGTDFAVTKGMPLAMFPVNGITLQWPVYDSHPDWDSSVAAADQPIEHQ